MDEPKIEDNGGRRLKKDRRTADLDPVSEKRKGQDRRCWSDRREDEDDPVIRITGDERRKAYRDVDIV